VSVTIRDVARAAGVHISTVSRTSVSADLLRTGCRQALACATFLANTMIRLAALTFRHRPA